MARSDGSWAVNLLVEHGLLGSSDEVIPRALTGGVSSAIVVIQRPAGTDLVVKRARRWLDVPTPWESDPGRIETEAAGLQLADRIWPGGCPPVVLVDVPTHTLVMHAAPRSWRPWKERLLDREIDESVARRLGSFLGSLHGETAGDAEVRERFEALTHLHDLRVRPFYGAAARHNHGVATELISRGQQLLDDRRCFVHGDYSPKNILVGGEDAWVVDFEVAHYGSPLFDLAYMLHHLAMKSLHLPDVSERLLLAARSFLASYRDAGGVVTADENGDLASHIGCLLLARVDGKSPSGYLRRAAELRIRSRAPDIVRDPPSTLQELWEQLTRD